MAGGSQVGRSRSVLCADVFDIKPELKLATSFTYLAVQDINHIQQTACCEKLYRNMNTVRTVCSDIGGSELLRVVLTRLPAFSGGAMARMAATLGRQQAVQQLWHC